MVCKKKSTHISKFTTNRLEVMHKIQKKNAAEANSGFDVTSVLKTLHRWHLSFERETERATDYEQFYREPKICLL